jgi:hypothetical protein
MIAGIFDPNFWGILGPKTGIFGVIFGSIIFEGFLDHFWGHFGDHFGTRSAQEGAKMGPRGPPRASKTQNPAFAKTLKNHWFFKVFGVQRPPKRGSRCP